MAWKVTRRPSDELTLRIINSLGMKGYKIKRIESVTLLPKLRGITQGSCSQLVRGNENAKKKGDAQSAPHAPAKRQKDATPAKGEATTATFEQWKEELLRNGSFQSYEDLHTALERAKEPKISPEKMTQAIKLLQKMDSELCLRQPAKTANSYLDIGAFLVEESCSRFALYFIEKANTLAKTHLSTFPELKKTFVRTQLSLWSCLEVSERHEQGIALLEVALPFATEVGESVNDVVSKLVLSYQLKSEQFYAQENYAQSVEYYGKCAEIYERKNNAEGKTDFLLKKADALLRCGETQLAIEISEKSLKGAATISKALRVSAYKVLAEAYHKSGELDEAEISYNTIYSLMKNEAVSKTTAPDGFVTFGLGRLNWEKGRWQDAIKYFREHFEDFLDQGAPVANVNASRTLFGLAQGYDGFDSFLSLATLSEAKPSGGGSKSHSEF